MAAPSGVAISLEGAFPQFATIQANLAPQTAVNSEPLELDLHLLPAPLPPQFVALSRAVAAVRALSSAALPLAAHALGHDQLRVVTLKQHVAGIFKLLREKQAACGIVIKDVKQHVSLAPLPATELVQALTCGFIASLLPQGWWQLDETRLLGASLLEPAVDGSVQACGSITLRVQAEPAETPSKLYLLVRAEQVEFRHPACRHGASLEQRSSSLSGAECTLLPDMRPALIHAVRPADEATVDRLRPLWASHGMPLPPRVDSLVDVSLDCDPDAPVFPYPSCRVLGQAGLLSTASRRSVPAVQAVLAKLRDDLAATPIKFMGAKMRLAGTAHDWYPEGAPQQFSSRHQVEESAPPVSVFLTAREHAERSKQAASRASGGSSGAGLALGEAFQLASLHGGADPVVSLPGQPRPKRPHFTAGPKLQAAMAEAKRQLEEAEKAATLGKAATNAGQLVLSATAGTGPAQAAASSQQPSALRKASAVTAGGAAQKPAVPVFKKVGAAPAAPARCKAAAAGPGAAKRAAPDKPLAAGKRPKAAARALVAGAAGPRSIPPSPAVMINPSGLASAPVTAGAVPQSAVKGTAGKGTARASTTLDGEGAAMPPKAPAKPRAKAADIDPAAVAAKVLQYHASGMLGKLTVPELKAFLKSVRQPVGGKKGDLEERVRVHLGGPPAAAAALVSI